MANGLNQRQMIFVDGLVAGMSATEAYKSAGYKNSQAAAVSAHHLLRNPVAQELARRRAERAERANLSVDTVIGGLMVEATSSGHRASVRVRAWELLGKHLGMFGKNRCRQHS